MTRKYHLLDYPENLFVELNPSYRNELFQKLFLQFGTKKRAAQAMEIKLRTILNYERGFSVKIKREYQQLIPIRILKRMDGVCNLEKLEENVKAIRVRGGTKLQKPALPLVESPEIYSIIGHMIADGSQSAHHTPYYSNSDQTLRSNFVKKLKVFGNAVTKERQTPTVPIVEFQKVITDILQHCFDFKITYPDRIPESVFSATAECKTAFIAALFDDDGSFSELPVLTIHNMNLINQVKQLLNSLSILTNKIGRFRIEGKTDKVWVSVNSKSIERFYKIIPIESPSKKENLQVMVETKKRNKIQRTRDSVTLRNRILNILDERPHKTMEIARILLFTIGGVLPHLESLESEGKIVRTGFKNAILWRLF